MKGILNFILVVWTAVVITGCGGGGGSSAGSTGGSTGTETSIVLSVKDGVIDLGADVQLDKIQSLSLRNNDGVEIDLPPLNELVVNGKIDLKKLDLAAGNYSLYLTYENKDYNLNFHFGDEETESLEVQIVQDQDGDGTGDSGSSTGGSNSQNSGTTTGGPGEPELQAGVHLIVSGPDVVQVGEKITLTFFTEGGDSYQLQEWEVNGEFLPEVKNPLELTPTSAGVLTVVAHVSDENGYEHTVKKVVTVEKKEENTNTTDGGDTGDSGTTGNNNSGDESGTTGDNSSADNTGTGDNGDSAGNGDAGIGDNSQTDNSENNQTIIISVEGNQVVGENLVFKVEEQTSQGFQELQVIDIAEDGSETVIDTFSFEQNVQVEYVFDSPGNYILRVVSGTGENLKEKELIIQEDTSSQ